MRLLRIVCQRPQIDISVEMGDGPATPTAGLSAWETIDRLEDKSITDPASVPPFAQSVPIMLDGLSTGASVQGTLDKIESLGGVDPAVFNAFGPIHRPGLRYILGGEIEYGEAVRDEGGALIRQRLTLPLTEYVPAPTIRRRRRNRSRPGTANWQVGNSFYITKQGDTLERIAAKLFGDAARWPEIARKNGIHDPLRQFNAGRKIKL